MAPVEDAFYKILESKTQEFHPVVPFNPYEEKLISFDLSENNQELKAVNIADIMEFGNYISNQLEMYGAKFGYGGYNELRSLYNRSELFDTNLATTQQPIIAEEPRRLHIGIDIWGVTGTEVYAPLNGVVHSFAYNDHLGDYGATIILSHQLNDIFFHTLYGHISLKDIENLKKGSLIIGGQKFATFGNVEENGYWPPHLHFQIIKNMSSFKGDYPGVCKLSERNQYLENSPDPDLLLGMRKFIT
ncbi:MAG: peptidoglycan DD-metalloendopeptidase family protein [Ginsengibacter sp.]